MCACPRGVTGREGGSWKCSRYALSVLRGESFPAVLILVFWALGAAIYAVCSNVAAGCEALIFPVAYCLMPVPWHFGVFAFAPF